MPAWLASPQRERPTAPARSLVRALSIIAIAAAAAMLVPLGLLGYRSGSTGRSTCLTDKDAPMD